jgi:hypothetical protein
MSVTSARYLLLCPCKHGQCLFTRCGYGSIEAAIPERVFDEALYQLVVLDNEDYRQFQSYSPQTPARGFRNRTQWTLSYKQHTGSTVGTSSENKIMLGP